MLKNTLLIFISIIILYFTIEEFGYLFLSIPTFLLLSYNLSDLILKIFSTNHKNNKKDKSFEYVILIGFISYFFVLRDYEQTIGGYILFWKLVFFSLLFNVLTLIILNKFYNFKNDKKFTNIFSVVFCYFLLIPNVGTLINKKFNVGIEKKERIEINYKDRSRSRGSYTYSIYIKTEFDKNERLDIKEEFYDSISNGQIVVLTMSKGILGYYYVKKIE